MFERVVDLLHRILYRMPEMLLVGTGIVSCILFVTNRLSAHLDSVCVVLGSVVLASLYLIWVRKRTVENNISEQYLFSFNQKRLTTIFFICALILLTTNLLVNGRPFWLLILHGLLYGIIIFQLFSKGGKTNIILVELMITTAFLLIPQMFGVAFYYGCGDILVHTQWTYLISETGNISELLGTYSSYFTYHVLSSIISQTGLIPINYAIYTISIVAFIISIIYVYHIFFEITSSRQISLTGLFIYITSNILLLNFLKPAPRIMATMGFIILLYLIFKKFKSSFCLGILGIIIAIYVTLTHHAQSPVFIFVLLLLCLGSLIYHKKLFIGNKIIYIIYAISIVSYFIYTYLYRIIDIVDRFVTPYLLSGERQADSMVIADPEISMIFLKPEFQNFFTVFIGLIGLYVLIVNTKRDSKLITLLPLSLVAMVIMSGIADVLPGATGLGTYRWKMVFIIVFALIMALGISYIVSTMGKNKAKHKKIGTFIVMVLCLSIVITSPLLLNSMDNEIQYSGIFEPNEYFYFDSDIALFNYMSENIALDSKIYSDREHTKWAYHSGTSSIYLPYYQFKYSMVNMFTEPESQLNTDYLIYPKERFYRVGLWLLTGSDSRELIKASDETINILSQNVYSYSSVYNNGDSINFYLH